MRKSLWHGSNSEDRERIKFDQERWDAGTINDPPAASIPANALAYSENAICHPREIVPRLGSTLWTSSELPPLYGRISYTATKSGYRITATTNAFTATDIGNCFVWPGNPDEHDTIKTYISATEVDVVDSGIKSTPQAGCFVRGKVNGRVWHTKRQRFVILLGPEAWIVTLAMDNWVRVARVSRDAPANSISELLEFDDNTVRILNSNGIFTVDLSYTDPIMFKSNTPVPNNSITEQAKTTGTKWQYNYLYGSNRLNGNAILLNRNTPARIEQESGVNESDGDGKDYAEVWTESPIGPSDYTYGKLTCDTLTGVYLSAVTWSAITDWVFKININSIGVYEIYGSFLDIESMAEAASVIQLSLRDFFPDATCEFNDNRFIITSGRVNGGTVSYMTAGTSGTDISALLQGTEATGAVITTPYVNAPVVIGPLYVPEVKSTSPQEYQWHLTHFPVYRNMDMNGAYRQGTSELRLNDPERFIWVKDLRMGAAMYGRKFNNHALLSIGEFELADVGSTIEWDDGSRNTILDYVDPHDVVIGESSGYGIETGMMACCIGNGVVMRASQMDDTVTRTDGGTFASDCVGKSLIWATGFRSVVKTYMNVNQVRVYDSITKVVQGLTFDPVYRYFNDSTTDDQLRTRQTTLLCKSRFLQPMSNYNTGAVASGFMLTALRNTGAFEYCQLPSGQEYFAGYHNKGWQYSKDIKDSIQCVLVFTNRFIVIGSRKTWGGPLSTSEFVALDKTGVLVAVIGGIDVIDGNIGCSDRGSIQPIEQGAYRMLTNEGGRVGLRDFNGYSYGPDLLEQSGMTNWADSIQKLQKASCSAYDGIAGYLVWGKE